MELFAILVIIAIPFAVIGLFFIFRELVLWYWRLNHIADTLTAIDAKLAKLTEEKK